MRDLPRVPRIDPIYTIDGLAEKLLITGANLDDIEDVQRALWGFGFCPTEDEMIRAARVAKDRLARDRRAFVIVTAGIAAVMIVALLFIAMGPARAGSARGVDYADARGWALLAAIIVAAALIAVLALMTGERRRAERKRG